MAMGPVMATAAAMDTGPTMPTAMAAIRIMATGDLATAIRTMAMGWGAIMGGGAAMAAGAGVLGAVTAGTEAVGAGAVMAGMAEGGTLVALVAVVIRAALAEGVIRVDLAVASSQAAWVVVEVIPAVLAAVEWVAGITARLARAVIPVACHTLADLVAEVMGEASADLVMADAGKRGAGQTGFRMTNRVRVKVKAWPLSLSLLDRLTMRVFERCLSTQGMDEARELDESSDFLRGR